MIRLFSTAFELLKHSFSKFIMRLLKSQSKNEKFSLLPLKGILFFIPHALISQNGPYRSVMM